MAGLGRAEIRWFQRTDILSLYISRKPRFSGVSHRDGVLFRTLLQRPLSKGISMDCRRQCEQAAAGHGA